MPDAAPDPTGDPLATTSAASRGTGGRLEVTIAGPQQECKSSIASPSADPWVMS